MIVRFWSAEHVNNKVMSGTYQLLLSTTRFCYVLISWCVTSVLTQVRVPLSDPHPGPAVAAGRRGGGHSSWRYHRALAPNTAIRSADQRTGRRAGMLNVLDKRRWLQQQLAYLQESVSQLVSSTFTTSTNTTVCPAGRGKSLLILQSIINTYNISHPHKVSL